MNYQDGDYKEDILQFAMYEGFEGLVLFDNLDGPSWLLEQFHWSEAPLFILEEEEE